MADTDFGGAFTAMKAGSRITRAAWAVSGANLRIVPAVDDQPAQFVFNSGADGGNRDSVVANVALLDFLATDWQVVA